MIIRIVLLEFLRVECLSHLVDFRSNLESVAHACDVKDSIFVNQNVVDIKITNVSSL